MPCYPPNTSEEAQKIAAKEGFVCRFPHPNELLIDLDELPNSTLDLELRDCLAFKGIFIDAEIDIPSKSSGKRHRYITLNRNLDTFQRIALQSIFGSDKKRELYSFDLAVFGDKNPTILFEKPETDTESYRKEGYVKIEFPKPSEPLDFGFIDDDVPF